jgi:hypothetical protein
MPLVLAWLLLAPQAACLTNYGRTACGYHCLAAHGEIDCARTSAGVCDASTPHVVCWDPPDIVRAHYGSAVPAAACLMRDGEVACGYHCEAHDETVRCAATPDGVCDSTSRDVVCWDPPPSNYCVDPRPLPRPA